MKSTIECPYPTVCEYDAYRKTGKHFCERVVCPYALHLGALLRAHKRYAESLKTPHSGAQARESG
ncbi:MAG: hypothetical protein ACLRKZ_05290 [Acutalibacteraceae bacterium]